MDARPTLSASILALAACTEPRTELVVAVHSEFSWGPGQELQALSVRVRRGGATGAERFRGTNAVGPQEPWRLPLTFALSPADDADTTPLWIEVRGHMVRDPERYTPELPALATQRADVNYRPGERAVLHLWLTRACRGVRCEPNQRCGRTTGVCEAATQANGEVRPFSGGAIPGAEDVGRLDAGMSPDAPVASDQPPPLDQGPRMEDSGTPTGKDAGVVISDVTDAGLQDGSAADTGTPVTGLMCTTPRGRETCDARFNCCAFALGRPVGCGCQLPILGCVTQGVPGCL